MTENAFKELGKATLLHILDNEGGQVGQEMHTVTLEARLGHQVMAVIDQMQRKGLVQTRGESGEDPDVINLTIKGRELAKALSETRLAAMRSVLTQTAQ